MRFISTTMKVAVLLVLGSSLAQGQQRPNVVVLFADDAGYADFGFMNQLTGKTTEFKTPNLDALAQESTLFSQAYVTAPVCSASRAGLLTGRYQQRFGVDYNFSNASTTNDGIPTTELLLTEAMKQQGYKTGVVGKWHIGFEIAKRPQNQGVDEFYGILEGGRPYFHNPSSPGVAVRRNESIISWSTEPSFNNIAPDPTLGRQFTDALGDEASRFIADSANQANPFFLYVPFTSPHSPYVQAKAQDIAEFDSTSLTGLRKNAAALTFAMDRAIGNVLSRLEDPNGDGDTADSVSDNTIVVFLNDNGGAPPSDPQTQGQMVHDNSPLKNYKGTNWEGGIRVPMLMRIPNGPTGVFNQAVSAMDLFPTFVSAAGGAIPGNVDGVDLMPYLNGSETGVVHETMFWRLGVNGFAVRKGDFKLTRGNATAFPRLYKLNADGTGEDVVLNLNGQYQSVVDDLVGELVDWEVTLAKPTQTTSFTFNRFDSFQLRTDIGANTKWSQAGVWVNAAQPLGSTVTMTREDPYANASLVFTPRNDADYTTQNDMSRAVGLAPGQIAAGNANLPGLAEFMLNELRFDGDFSGAANHSGTLTGFPLMFVKNLSGQSPRMLLNSTRQGGSQFAFNVNMDIVLHDNLEVSGDSALTYSIAGQIRDFRGPRSLKKSGASTLTLTGDNTYAGNTIVDQGVLRIAGANAAIRNTASVQIGSNGSVELAAGLLRTPSLQIDNGGSFSFTGGTLQTGSVDGDLTVSGGEFKVGMSTGLTIVQGSYSQISGSLGIEIGGVGAAAFDRLVVGESATLGGQLNVGLVGAPAFTPQVGNVFEILTTGGGVSGSFSSVLVPSLPAGRNWAIQYRTHSVVLQVVDQLPGDFDNNGKVNALDLQAWTNSGSGRTGKDFLLWQRQYGAQIIPPNGSLAQVPEPGSAALAVFAGIFAALSRRRGRIRVAGTLSQAGEFCDGLEG